MRHQSADRTHHGLQPLSPASFGSSLEVLYFSLSIECLKYTGIILRDDNEENMLRNHMTVFFY